MSASSTAFYNAVRRAYVPPPPPPSPSLSRVASESSEEGDLPPLPPSPINNFVESPADRVPLIQMPTTQAYLFFLLTTLHTALPNSSILARLRKRFGPTFQAHDAFRYFLKGGAVTPLLLYKHVGSPPYDTFPFPIENDFDCTILINPSLPTVDFQGLQRYLVTACVNTLTSILSESMPFRTAVKTEWTSNGYTVVESKPTFFSTNMTAEDMYPRNISKSFASLFSEKDTFETMDKESLFRLSVFSEYFYQREPLYMTLIQVIPNVTDGQSILDIVIPKRSNPMLSFDWKNALPDPFVVSIPYLDQTLHVNVPLVDAPFLYLDQRISANRVRNSAPAKFASRTRRANLLRNRLLRPQRATPESNRYKNDPLFKNSTMLYNHYVPANILANTRGYGGGRRVTRRQRRK